MRNAHQLPSDWPATMANLPSCYLVLGTILTRSWQPLGHYDSMVDLADNISKLFQSNAEFSSQHQGLIAHSNLFLVASLHRGPIRLVAFPYRVCIGTGGQQVQRRPS